MPLLRHAMHLMLLLRHRLLRVLALLTSWLCLSIVAMPSQGATGGGYYVFFKKPPNWQKVNLYTWYRSGSSNQETSGAWPGKALADVGGWYRGFIDEKLAPREGHPINLIFNDGNGQQTPDLLRAKNGWYVWKDGGQLIDRWYDLNPDEKLYPLTIENGQGSGQFSAGSLVKFQAETRDEQNFIAWQGADASLLSDPTQSYGQLQMPARPVTLRAKFEDLSGGQQRYVQLCAGCHGPRGEGKVGPSLLFSDGRCPSCSSDDGLSDRIARTMPIGKVGTCTGECARSIARYIRAGLNQGAGESCASSPQSGKRQLRLLSRSEFRGTVRALFGIDDLNALRTWPEPALVRGFDNNADASVVSDRHLLVFTRAAEEIATRRSLTDLAGSDCRNGSDARCLVQRAAEKIFRAPLDSASVDAYLSLYTNQGGKKLMMALLLSPRFLYRSELGSFVAPLNAYMLSPYEIASALSYGFTAMPPDEELLRLAASGELKQAAVRRSQSQRLLKTPEAQAHFAEFVQQWLGIGSLPFVTRDDPQFNATIRRDMLEETRRAFADLVFEQAAPVSELFRSDSRPLSQALARYYGLPVPAADWDRVSGLGSRRGILGLGSVLASYANSTEASPIKRGVFVRNQLLCQDLPPPPANVDTTIPPPAPGLTIRERLARHITQGAQSDGSNACFSCHQYIDKVGFGMEGFDGSAKARDFYPEKPTQPIDLSGEVKGVESLADGAVLSFQNQIELGEILARSKRSKQCFGTQYFRYFHGRIEGKDDQCELKQQNEVLTRDASIIDYMAGFVADDSFIYRR